MAALALIALATALTLLAGAVGSEGAAPTATSPWPLPQHDSSQANAAAPSVPAYSSFKATNLFVPANGSDTALIPAPGVYFITPDLPAIGSNFTVYYRSNKTISVVNFSSEVSVAGFDPSAALRLYLWTDEYFGAYSLTSNSMVWNISAPEYGFILYIFPDSFSDSVDVVYSDLESRPCSNGCFSRYTGSSGKLLWTLPFAYSALATIPATGALIVQDFSEPAYAPLFAYDAATGKQLWMTPSPNVTDCLPLAFDNQLVLDTFPYEDYGGNESLVSYDGSTGALLWNLTLPYSHPDAPCSLDQLAAVSLDGSTIALLGVIFCEPPRSSLITVEPRTGVLLHRVHLTDPTGNGVGSLAAVGDVVYFTLGPSVHTFNVTSGGVATVFTGDDNIAFMRVDSDGALLVAFEASPMHLLMPQKLA